MKVGLIEGVMGRFLSGQPISDVRDEERQRLMSIKEHLASLFNTRRGSLNHLSDYGLPDISEIYDNMPESIGMLQRAIKETVETYEPRLTQVQVLKHEEAEEHSTAFSVSFDLIAQIVDGPTAYFRAHFSTIGPVQVNPLRRRQQ
jgi:type VI secretion system protein